MKKSRPVSLQATIKSVIANQISTNSSNKQSDFKQEKLYSIPFSDSQQERPFYHGYQDNDTFIHSPVHKIHEYSKPAVWCYSITPVHLKSLDIICKIFGRSRYTVKQWAKEGAPIVYDGVSYISEYNALFAWLLDFYRRSSNR